MQLTEKGTLPIGVEYEGKVHREYELREQLVSDAVNIFDDAIVAERAQKNAQYLACCVIANMILKIGDIPKEMITGDLVNSMYQDDYNELNAAEARLDAQRATFRKQDAKHP